MNVSYRSRSFDKGPVSYTHLDVYKRQGYLGAGNFLLALMDDMNELQRLEFAKGLSLEMMLKVRINNEKQFLLAHYQCVKCQPGSGRAEEEINSLIQDYYNRIMQESPVRTMREKRCV